MLTKIPDRQKEGESKDSYIIISLILSLIELITEAYSLADQMPFWSNKIIHVSIPELDL